MTRQTVPPWQTVSHLHLGLVRLRSGMLVLHVTCFWVVGFHSCAAACLTGDEELPAVALLHCSTGTVCKAELHHHHHPHHHHLEQNDTLTRAASL